MGSSQVPPAHPTPPYVSAQVLFCFALTQFEELPLNYKISFEELYSELLLLTVDFAPVYRMFWGHRLDGTLNEASQIVL